MASVKSFGEILLSASNIISENMPRSFHDSVSAADELALASYVEKSVLLRSVNVPPRISAHASKALMTIANSLSPASRVRMIKSLAAASERGRRSVGAGLHGTCEGDPVLNHRPGEIAINALVQSRTSGTSEILSDENGYAMALWALGRWELEKKIGYATGRMLTSESDTTTHLSLELGSLRPWPAHIVEKRNRDIRKILANKKLYRLYCNLLKTSLIEPEYYEQLVAFHREHSQGGTSCYCLIAKSMWSCLFDTRFVISWFTPRGNLVQESADFIGFVTQAAQPRCDLVAADGGMRVLDPGAFTSAALTAAMTLRGTAKASKWQENELRKEVARSFGQYGPVASGTPWITTDMRASDGHSGEVDALAFVDGVLFDFQAKAPLSTNFKSRGALIRTDALKQHLKLSDDLTKGVFFLEHQGPSARKLSEKPFSLNADSAVHVPISVGLETSYSFSVGGSNLANNPIGRVMTTLDHMRIVNELVPPPLRPIYWLARWSAEFSRLHFFDEMEFLGYWLESRGQIGYSAQSVKGYMFARADLAGEYLNVRNQLDHISNRSTVARDKIERILQGIEERLPTRRAPFLMNVVNELSSRHQAGWLRFAACSLEVDFLSAEERFQSKRPFQLETGWGKMVVVFDRVTRDYIETIVIGENKELGTVVVFPGRQGWEIVQSHSLNKVQNAQAFDKWAISAPS